MFAQRITNTAFTDTQVANVSKIEGDSVYDAVFISVLRAVLPLHMGDDERLYVRFRSNDLRYETCEEREADTICARLYSGYPDDRNAITFINLSSQRDIHEKLYAGFETRYPGWKRIERVTKFFEQIFKVLCFVNEEKKSVILVTGQSNVPNVHYLMCSLFAWFPWYFNKEQGVSKDEMDLMQSLRNHTSENFLAVLERFEEKYDFYSMKLEALAGFENQWMERERQVNVDKISRTMRDIESYSSSISELLKRKEQLEIAVLGIDAAIAKGGEDSELRDFFMNNKHRVRLVYREEDRLTFEVMTQFMYWDPEYAETLYNNKRSILYTKRGQQPRLRSEEMGMLFKAIFIDNKLELQVCAAYQIDISGCCTKALAGYDYGTECAKYIRNPHIDEFHCLGGYEQALYQMMEHHDYCGCLEQCVVSAQSINLTETPTMERFIPKFYGCDRNCIKLPDGKLVTPVEAVEFLKKSEEENENEQED